MCNGSYPLLFPPLGWGWDPDNRGRPDVPEVSLQSFREKSDHENPASVFFISWLEIDTLYIVEITQLKLIFEARGLHNNFLETMSV